MPNASRQNRPREIISKRLSVANLPHEMSEAQLQTLFSEAGHVASARIIPYLHNGQPLGFGFVEMKTLAETRKALSIFNGRTINGRLLAVREDRPQSKSVFGSRSRNRR
jgi:RNA recognition motif-containing protein